MDNAVSIQYKNEIISTIEKIFLHQNPILICQGLEEDKKECWALIKHLNSVTHEITLRPVNDEERFHFDQEQAVTVRNASESIVFESDIATFCKEKILSLKIPKEIKLSNTRNNTRYHFEEKNINVELINLSSSDHKKILNCKLFDISISGIALQVECVDIPLFSENHELNILKIHQMIIEDTFGKIVYIRKIQEAGATKYYKLGIHFNKLISLPSVLAHLQESE